MAKSNSLPLSMSMSTKEYCPEMKLPDLPLLTRKEEIELARKVKKGNKKQREAAQNKLIVHNLRLVISVAQRFTHKGVDMYDLVAEGNRGLMKATEKFDPDSKKANGAKFSTYASWWIAHYIRGAINSYQIVRYPMHLSEKYAKYLRISTELEGSLGRPPTAEELQEALPKYSLNIINFLLTNTKSMVSLDAPIPSSDGDDSKDFYDMVGGEEMTGKVERSASIHIEMSETKQALMQAIRALPERKQRILCLRFGIGGGSPMTLDEIGKNVGLTRERVRQIVEETIEDLHEYFDKNDLMESCKLSLSEFISG